MTIADGIARQTAVAIERARLVEESRRLVRAVESTEEAVLITDAQRRIIFANPAFMRTLGYRREEVIGRDAFEIAGHLPEPLEQFQETLLRRSWRGETIVHRSDGTADPDPAQRQPDPRRRRPRAGRGRDPRGHLRGQELPGADAARRSPRRRRRDGRRHRARDQQRAGGDLRPDRERRGARRGRAARRARPRRRPGAPHRRHRAGRARLRPPAPAAPGSRWISRR